MNLQSITLRDFKSYGPDEQTVDLADACAVGIGGPNGSGKSTLIEALTFALYGRAVATETQELGNDALINDRADEAFVSVSFEKDGNAYSVERTVRRRGPGKARLTSPILTQPIADVKAVNAKVESLLGMDYETFVSSTIVRQDEMDRLTSKRAAERKEILASIFGLQVYEAMQRRAHERADEVSKEISGLVATKEALKARISKEGDIRGKHREHLDNIQRLEEQQRARGTEKGDVEGELQRISDNKAEFDAKDAEKKTLSDQLKKDKRRAESLGDQMRQAEGAQKELEAIQSKMEAKGKLEAELSELVGRRERLKLAEAEWGQKAKALGGRAEEESENYRKIKAYAVPECPICKRPLDELHRGQLLEEYERKINDLVGEKRQCEQNARGSLEELNEQVMPAIDKIERGIGALKGLDRKAGELTNEINGIPKLKDEAANIEGLIAQNEKRINELEGRLRELGPTIQRYSELDKRRRELEGELASIQGNLGKEIANRDRAVKDLADIELDKKKHEELVGEIGDKGRIENAYELLEKQVFHKDGIPTAFLREIVPEIEQEASKILRGLSNGRMDISFAFGRKTKTGKVTEELIVEAIDQGRNHPVSRYSGGERMRINLALRLGVSEVVAKRSGYKGKIETLVVDEGFGALDEDGRKATVEILQALRERFKKILVISHIDDVREAFETRLAVTKPLGGYSSINIV